MYAGLVILISATLGIDGEPNRSSVIVDKAVAGFDIQTRERCAVGIMAGGIDGIARTIHFGRERHFAEI